MDDSDCNVGMISRVRPDAPGETAADTNLLFHQWKFRLYRIMGQFLGRRRQMNQVSTVQSIHDELSQWRNQLPNQLRIESYTDIQPDAEPSTPQMQAIALQLTYDNLQIILHRTVAFGQGSKIQTTPEGLFSLRHLVDAALQTSNLHRFPNALHAMRRTHANMHIGITLFTAGILLCIVCLSQPLSSTSQQAKGGVMHIIRACKDSANPQNVGSRQSIAVLERLVAVVLQHENQLITGSPEATLPVDEVVAHTDPVSQNATMAEPAPSSKYNSASKSKKLLIYTLVLADNNQPGLDISNNQAIPVTTATASDLEQAPSTLDGLDWDGSLSVLMDSGLADASQMWLWAQNEDEYSFE